MARRIRLVPGVAGMLVVLCQGCSISIGSQAPPAVSYTTPGDGTGNVPVSGTIKAVFSRAMDSSSITASSFLLYQGATQITGTVTASGSTAIFQPTVSLPFNALLTATITTAAKDTSGNSLAASHVWTFTTQLTFATMVLHFTTTFGSQPFTRYGGPVTLSGGGNTLSQAVNPDGSITLAITSAPGYEDDGFYFTAGPLSSLNSLVVTAGSTTGSFSANLWLDSNGDGDYFAWTSGNAYTGPGGDQYLNAVPSSVGNTLTIDATTTFGGYTLAQLKAGNLAGVNGNTIAAIWVGFSLSSGSRTTTITGIQQQ